MKFRNEFMEEMKLQRIREVNELEEKTHAFQQ